MFAILAGFTVSETARDSLFLGANGAGKLAVAYLLLAGIAVVALAGNAWLVRGVGRRNALIVTLAAAAAGTAFMYTLPRGPTGASPHAAAPRPASAAHETNRRAPTRIGQYSETVVMMFRTLPESGEIVGFAATPMDSIVEFSRRGPFHPA